VTKRGEATKIELYVPIAIPVASKKINGLIVEPPKTSIATKTNIAVKDVFSDLAIVWLIEELAFSAKLFWGFLL